MAEKVEYKFLITRKDWVKIQLFARYAHDNGGNEIGGMMVLSPITYDDESMYQLHCPVILEQEISGGNTVLTSEALAVHYGKMSDKFGKGVRHVWWHSHHKMAAFWSGTDDSTIMETKTPDFTVSLVINLFQEYKLRVQWFHPFEHEENVPLLILDKQMLEPVPQYIAKECDKLCTKRATSIVKAGYTRTVGNVRHYGSFNSSYQTQQDMFDPFAEGVEVDEPQFPASRDYMMIYDWLDDITGKLIVGETKYKEFRKVCEASNSNLKYQNNPFRIKMFKKKELEEEMYTMNTRDFIEVKGGGNVNDNLPL